MGLGKQRSDPLPLPCQVSRFVTSCLAILSTRIWNYVGFLISTENEPSMKGIQMELTLFFLFSAKMFKGGKEVEKAADMFFNQQDKNEDGYIDRVRFSLAKV